LFDDVAIPIKPNKLFLSKKCLNDTVIDDNSVKFTGVVIIRDTPDTLGSLLNINSLASPPALLVVEINQLSVELSDVVQPVGIDMESNVSLKMTDSFCAKIVTDNNNANVSSNVFFIFFIFCCEQRAMSYDAHSP
jgi:hypothetical protein